MNLSLVRSVGLVMLVGQLLPIGLPLLCDQVQWGAPANCEQRMASQPSGEAIGAATHATPCASSAFCPTTATAALTIGRAATFSAGEFQIVGFGSPTFAPADPQPPLPPPPQA